MKNTYDNKLAVIKADQQLLLDALVEAGAKVTSDLNHIVCPFHKEARGSLSVFSADGIWLYKCHGCDEAGTIVDVVARTHSISAGEAIKELKEQYGHLPVLTQNSAPQEPVTQKTATAYATLDDVKRMLERALQAPCKTEFHYFHADGTYCMSVLRFQLYEGKKTYMPVRYIDGHYEVGDPRLPKLPLYNLPALLASPHLPVVIVEGEKCADALLTQGYLATTSAHGAKSPQKTDWSPLAGRQCIIWPDKDEAGYSYRDSVSKLLSELNSPPHVSVIDPNSVPCLEQGEDVVDYLNKAA